MPTLYRVENQETQVGLWYNSRGEKTDYIVHEIPDAMNRDMPMDFDPTFVGWTSSAGSLEQMKHWFSADDVTHLAQAGYNLFQIEATDVRDVAVNGIAHKLFRREGALFTPIPFEMML